MIDVFGLRPGYMCITRCRPYVMADNRRREVFPPWQFICQRRVCATFYMAFMFWPKICPTRLATWAVFFATIKNLQSALLKVLNCTLNVCLKWMMWGGGVRWRKSCVRDRHFHTLYFIMGKVWPEKWFLWWRKFNGGGLWIRLWILKTDLETPVIRSNSCIVSSSCFCMKWYCTCFFFSRIC